MGIEMFLWQGKILYDNIQQISEYYVTLKGKKTSYHICDRAFSFLSTSKQFKPKLTSQQDFWL